MHGSVATRKYLLITGVIALYWCTSIGMVFINKYLLTDIYGIPDAPLFITWFQCAVSVVYCYLVQLCVQHKIVNISNESLPHLSFDVATCLNVLPVSIFFVAMISFNNLTLKHMSVSFYMVGRSLTTVFNVILSYLILRSKVSAKTIIACAVVVSGFLLGVDQENLLGTLTTIAMTCGVLSSACVALNAIYTKKVMPAVDSSVWKLTYFNNLNATVLFIPLIFLNGEFSTIVQMIPFVPFFQFWIPMLVAAFMGFCMSFVTGLQIKVTSPLTHNISGTAKAYVQTLIAVIAYCESKTGLWWFSNVLVLGGSAYYTHVKRREMEKEASMRTDDVEVMIVRDCGDEEA